MKFVFLTKYFDRKDYECRYMLLPQYFSFFLFFFSFLFWCEGSLDLLAPTLLFLSIVYIFSLYVRLFGRVVWISSTKKKIYLLSHQDVYNGQFNKIYFLVYFFELLTISLILSFSFLFVLSPFTIYCKFFPISVLLLNCIRNNK